MRPAVWRRDNSLRSLAGVQRQITFPCSPCETILWYNDSSFAAKICNYIVSPPPERAKILKNADVARRFAVRARNLFLIQSVCDNLSALQDSFLLDADKLTLSHTLPLSQTQQCEDTSPESRGQGARLEANFDPENQQNEGKAGETQQHTQQSPLGAVTLKRTLPKEGEETKR